MSQRELAEYLLCDVKVINRIVNGRTSVTAEMAFKLGVGLSDIPEFWLNAQKAVDLYRASQEIGELPPPIRAAG